MADMLDTIRKLLAKAEGTNNEAEADAFFTKAQQLMEKHAIAEAQVRAGMSYSERSKPITKDIVMPEGDLRLTRYRNDLLHAICRYNRVISFYMTKDHRTIRLAGFDSDVNFCSMLYHSILIQMDQAMLKLFFDEESHTTQAKATSFKDSIVTDQSSLRAIKAASQRTFRPEFMAGYVDRIGQRLYDAEQDREQSREPGMALVLRNTVQDVHKWLEDEGYHFAKARSNKVGNYQRNEFARGAGASAANNANLNNVDNVGAGTRKAIN